MGGAGKKLDGAVTQVAAEHLDRPVEVWAEDEHRPGLKPVHRRTWVPVGRGRSCSAATATNGCT